MKLAHVALWCRDLEGTAAFWDEHFGARIGERYVSTRRLGFVSRFVYFDDGATLELMSIPGLEGGAQETERPGWEHVAISLGSEAAVDALAARMEALGLLVSSPRRTGDGFYEAVIRDSEGNLVEVTS